MRTSKISCDICKKELKDVTHFHFQLYKWITGKNKADIDYFDYTEVCDVCAKKIHDLISPIITNS